MKKASFILLLFSVLCVSCQRSVKIACVGDSITNGGGMNYSDDFYPVQLGEMLGDPYLVMNFGESGATMQKDGNKPYWSQKDMPNVFVYQPDIVVIMLGTNDSKTDNWNAASYEKDYQTLIDTLSNMPSNPKIYLCYPPPAYSSAWTINDSTIRHGILPIIDGLAEKNNLPVIDVYNNMLNMEELFPDGIHPNSEGKSVMAGIVAGAIAE